MKKTVIIASVVVATWVGGSVWAAVLLPALPRLAPRRVSFAALGSPIGKLPALGMRVGRLDERVRIAEIIRLQA